MDAEHPHGHRRVGDVLARRTLSVGRLARAFATVALAAVAANSGAAGRLSAAGAADLSGHLDPVVAGLLRSRSACGATQPFRPVTDAGPFEHLKTGTPQAEAAAIGRSREILVMGVANGTTHATLLAQTSTDTPPLPTPAAVPTASPAPAATDASGAVVASPSPAPSGTFVPIPPVPPNGPGQLLPPTPRATGSPSPSPVPLPTTSPSAAPSGPVFLVRPSGTPQPLQPVGASPSPGATAAPSASAGGSATPASSGPTTAPSYASGAPGSASPEPGTSAVPTGPAPTAAPTLGPYQIVTIADRIDGSSDSRKPTDLSGNVHVFYTEGQIVGDRAHYDGDHTLVVSGHTYVVNRSADSILYADRISFDTVTRKATLENGSGESVEGVQQGLLHFSAQTLTTGSDGVSHGDRASFTTCEHPHGGYHIEARSIDVTPGDKLVARKAVVFLGPLAIFYLPLLVIPLREVGDPRRQASFLPIIGYDQVDGFFVKLKIGFAPSDTYYGYYRVEYFTRRGLGLGYTAFAGAKDGRRYLTVDSYTIDDRTQNARETNVNLQETENFNRRLRSQVGIDYQGDYGPGLSLPATLNVTGSLIRQGVASTENLTFSRYLQGSLSDNLNLGFVDSLALGPNLQQQLNFSYSKFNSQLSSSNTFHINTDTHLFTKAADYDLTYDKTDYSTNPFGYDRLPELSVLPHLTYGGFKFGPQLQFTAGEYAEPQNHFATQRVQAQLNEAVYFKVLGNSDFSANYNLTQDYYGTGDLKANDQQNASLTTPVSDHIVNALTYNESHPIGPPDVPFQLLDRLSPGTHSAQDVFRFFNKDVYAISLGTGTDFNREAQPINYQATLRPSPRSYVTVGGYYSPGPGNGFYTTNIQAITPFGRDTTLELTTNVDWKNKGRLEDKNVYLSRTIAECYNLQFAYNQDLKSFTFNVVILAFPGQSAGFGFGGNAVPSGILPQNFAF